MSKIIITQVKSAINRPEDQKRTLLALGLRGINKKVTHQEVPTVMGMVNKVKHLVVFEKTK